MRKLAKTARRPVSAPGLRPRPGSGDKTVFPVAREIAASELTLSLAFRRLDLHEARCFAFETSQHGVPGRHAYLFFDPLETLRIRDGGLVSETPSGAESIAGNALEALERRVRTYRLAPGAERLPPFAVGFVGYLGYDCVQYLERVPMPATPSFEDEATFVLFRHVVVIDLIRGRGLVIENTLPSDGPSEIAGRNAQKNLDAIIAKLGREQAAPLRPRPARGTGLVPLTESRFESGVLELKAHIRAGDIFQAVLARRHSFVLEAHPFSVYRELKSINPSPYQFYFDAGSATLVGASPEMLVRVDHGTVSTCPIAGTRPRGKSPAEDRRLERSLIQSTKERAEHLMLVDLSRNDLGRVCRAGTVTVPQFQQVQRFSHVMHLVSRVEGKLKPGISPLQALLSCFPAGTLTGAPKIRAMELLSGLEPHRRGAYGGTVCLLGLDGQLDSCITIRTLVSRVGDAYLQAGAGIVADSHPAREYRETEQKLQATRSAIASAEALAMAERVVDGKREGVSA